MKKLWWRIGSFLRRCNPVWQERRYHEALDMLAETGKEVAQLRKQKQNLQQLVIRVSQFKCDIGLHNTLPDCRESYPNEQSHWCIGCTAQDLLETIQKVKQ